MRLERAYRTAESEESALSRADEYLRNAKYKQVGRQPLPTYRRGSMLGTFTSFLPTEWHARATILTRASPGEATQVFVSVDVDTTGQILVKRERGFWAKELDGLVAALGGMDVQMSLPADERARIANAVYEQRKGKRPFGVWFLTINDAINAAIAPGSTLVLVYSKGVLAPYSDSAAVVAISIAFYLSLVAAAVAAWWGKNSGRYALLALVTLYYVQFAGKQLYGLSALSLSGEDQVMAWGRTVRSAVWIAVNLWYFTSWRARPFYDRRRPATS